MRLVSGVSPTSLICTVIMHSKSSANRFSSYQKGTCGKQPVGHIVRNNRPTSQPTLLHNWLIGVGFKVGVTARLPFDTTCRVMGRALATRVGRDQLLDPQPHGERAETTSLVYTTGNMGGHGVSLDSKWVCDVWLRACLSIRIKHT